ncbi:hypothetical protein [Ramlibacter albus]|uniref:Lipoprotein n=1 Tax=Ramlibacter albus TaxID=2079448 RepID=A0A923S5G4_9BURK|nr:hypothetical protein [Ramlibacter albus]MBC5768545.1 hypothetical protein [Ramlibacter albus]
MRYLCLLLLTLAAGCATLPPPQQAEVSPCTVSEASFACQVERYHNVNVP